HRNILKMVVIDLMVIFRICRAPDGHNPAGACLAVEIAVVHAVIRTEQIDPYIRTVIYSSVKLGYDNICNSAMVGVLVLLIPELDQVTKGRLPIFEMQTVNNQVFARHAQRGVSGQNYLTSRLRPQGNWLFWRTCSLKNN